MEKNKVIGIGGFLLALIMILQNLGIVVINPDNPDTPVTPSNPDIVVPDEPKPDDPTPVIPDNPNPPIDPNKDILLTIEAENFPVVPPSYEAISKPVYDVLVACENAPGSLILARSHAQWSRLFLLPEASMMRTTGSYREQRIKSLQAMLSIHNMDSICPGLSIAVDGVINQALGGKQDRALTSDDFLALSKAHDAIAGRAFEAFQRIVQ
jgi:hypothetical protein